MATGEQNSYVKDGQIGLMFIEPKGTAKWALIDPLTCKMTAALRKAAKTEGYFGTHTCSCGAESDNYDHVIGNMVTNSLAVHYLAYHRDEVPREELEKVAALKNGSEIPSYEELGVPPIPEDAKKLTREQAVAREQERRA